MTETCAYCGGPKAIRNPSGVCDHLMWPENLTDVAKRANGVGVLVDDKDALIERLQQELDELRNGSRAIIPQTKDHAEKLYVVAVASPKSFDGVSPEQSIRAKTIEECAKIAEGWEVEAGGGTYMTSGGARFWDGDHDYHQARMDAASDIRSINGGGKP